MPDTSKPRLIIGALSTSSQFDIGSGSAQVAPTPTSGGGESEAFPTTSTPSNDGTPPTKNEPARTPAKIVFSFGGNSSNNEAPADGGFAFDWKDSSSAFSAGPSKPTASLHDFFASKHDTKKKVQRGNNQVRNDAPSLEGYEQYRSFMDKLATSGVDDYIDLPMIAVMGDTSSGKSSLLSNISNVELPSSSTLTTRCPIRLQMRNDAVRTAVVRVVWKDRPRGEDADFPERTVVEEDWDEITNVIAEAQGHIIEKSGKAVARDVVCVDMKGPHCENLTLVDLPGIVRATGKGESETLAEDIHALMQDYLNNER